MAKKYIYIVLLVIVQCKLLYAQEKKRVELGDVKLGVFVNAQYGIDANKWSYGTGLYIIRKEAPLVHFFEAGVNYAHKKTWNPFIVFEQVLFFIDYNMIAATLRTDMIFNRNTYASISPGIALDAFGMGKIYYNFNLYYYRDVKDPSETFKPNHTIGITYRILGLKKMFD
jgi:hypothetical protein